MKLRQLTLDRLLTAIVFISVFTMAVRVPADTDTWWHLQSGRWIVENRAIPNADFFSHTRYGEPWIDHSWLAQIVLFSVYDSLGHAGLALLVAGLVTVAFVLVWRRSAEGNRWLRAFVLVLAAATSSVIWAARPQLFSFALTALVAYLLDQYKHGRPRVIWWLPLIILVWVNTHGGFALGFILMLAHLVGEAGNRILRSESMGWGGIGRLAVVIGVCLLVVPANPNGIQMWTYPFRTVSIGVLQDYIAEWSSPDFHQLFLHPFIWMLLATVTSLGLSGRRADLTDLTLVALFTYMSLLAGRNIALFALVAAPVIIEHGTITLREWRERVGRPPENADIRPPRTAVNWALLALVVVAALVKVSQPLSPAVIGQAESESFPVSAVTFLRDHGPSGPMLNSYNWGGYLIWHLPEYPVYVDGRTDLYDDAFLREYLSIVAAENGWEKTLEARGISLVLIETQSTLARLLYERPGWERIYIDEMATIFVRR